MQVIRRLIRASLAVEGLNSLAGFLGLGNPLGVLATVAGAIAVGWWAAAQGWAEGVLAPYGTLGFVLAVLVVALLLVSTFAVCSLAYIRLGTYRARHKTENSRGIRHEVGDERLITPHIRAFALRLVTADDQLHDVIEQVRVATLGCVLMGGMIWR